jgi:hypothetical protein
MALKCVVIKSGWGAANFRLVFAINKQLNKRRVVR